MNGGGRPPVSFAVFFTIWAKQQRWIVPLLHYRICEWLEHNEDRVRVLKVL